MPSLFEIEKENETPSIIKKYVGLLHEKTERNVIVYYSGFLSTPPGLPIEINDMDKNGFMAMCHELNVEDGLDLILHTPLTVAEHIVLHRKLFYLSHSLHTLNWSSEKRRVKSTDLPISFYL